MQYLLLAALIGSASAFSSRRSTDIAPLMTLRGGDLQSLWQDYSAFSERHPFESNMATCGAIAGLGDALVQVIDQSSSGYDYLRTLRFVTYRVAVVMPLYTAWMALLNKASLPGPPLQQAATKAILDNMFFSPPAQLLFYTTMALLEGKNGQVALQRCASMLPVSLPASWVFWIPIQLVCFGLIPPHLRVAYVQAVGFVWNMFLSAFGQSARSTK